MMGTGGINARIEKLVSITRAEWRMVLYSFTYHFSLLCGYYIIRPIRDEMSIAGGVERLQWMFSGTFLVMLVAVPLFGWVTRSFPRHIFMPSVYLFFTACLLTFYVIFNSGIRHEYAARAFFIWASVFNLFIVSVFWSFMADIFSTEQSKRLFGIIAAGGTAGALSGPALTAILVSQTGTVNLLLISAFFLCISVYCIWKLSRKSSTAGYSPTPRDDNNDESAIGGSVLAALKLVIRSPYLSAISLFMLLYTTLSTFLYFHQAYIIRNNFSNPDDRTALFALMDFSVNFLTLAFQIFFTGRFVKFFGISRTLAAVPLFLIAGFLTLTFSSAAWILIVIQVIRRAGDYSVTKPAREMLYVVLGREEKYKAKNLIDTVIYRGGDALSSWIYTGLSAVGMSLAIISAMAVPIAAAWARLSLRIGSRYEQISMMDNNEKNS